MENRNNASGPFYRPSGNSVEGLPNTLYVGHEPPRVMLQPHWHAQVELNYMVRGTMDYRIGTRVMRLVQGDLIVFWGGMAHQTLDVSGDADYVCMHLPLTDFFRIRLPADTQRHLVHGGILLATTRDPADPFNFLRWADYLRFGSESMVENALDEVLLRIERTPFGDFHLLSSDQRPSIEVIETEGAARLHVARICSFIGDNFREPINCSDIAAAAEIHPKYAMNVFKKSTGMTLNQYVTLLRLSYAQALLTEGPESVMDVAMNSGFGSLSAFNKSFQKLAGRSPIEYRRGSRGRLGAIGLRRRLASMLPPGVR